MKTWDFINQAIGNYVYIIRSGDNVMNGDIKELVYNKTKLKLLELNKGGMCVCEKSNGQKIKIPPTQLREYSELE